MATTADEDEGDTYEHRVYRLLEDAVRDELAVYTGILNLDLSDEKLDSLAWAVATRVGMRRHSTPGRCRYARGCYSGTR